MKLDDFIPLLEFIRNNCLYFFIWLSILLLSNNKFFNSSFFSSFGSILFIMSYFFIISLSYNIFRLSLSPSLSLDKILFFKMIPILLLFFIFSCKKSAIIKGITSLYNNFLLIKIEISSSLILKILSLISNFILFSIIFWNSSIISPLLFICSILTRVVTSLSFGLRFSSFSFSSLIFFFFILFS